MIVAALVQAFEIKLSPMINEDTLSHIIAIFANLVMFVGINKLH